MLITWFRYGTGSWCLNVPVSGHEERGKARVCLHVQSLSEICEAKEDKSSLLKKNYFGFCHPYIHR